LALFFSNSIRLKVATPRRSEVQEERVEYRDRHLMVAYNAAGASAVAAESWNATFLSGFDMQIA